jgi:hypothetical protein
LISLNAEVLIQSATLILVTYFLIFSLAFSVINTHQIYADPKGTNASFFIEKAKQSLAVGDAHNAIANLTRAVELLAVLEPKNFYDFVAVGDWGCTTNTDETVESILDKNPNLVIGLGDYSYEATPDCWLSKISSIEKITKIVIGNHDDPTLYLKRFGLDKQYYYFDYGNVHFLMMSTEIPFETGSPQYEYVKNDLQKASLNPKINWVIVANHRTTYYPGVAVGPDRSILNKFPIIYAPLFD